MERRYVFVLKTRQIVIQRLRRPGKAVRANARHLNTAYARRLNTTLVYAQNAKVSIYRQIIAIGFHLVEIFTLFDQNAWWGGPLGNAGHLVIDYVIPISFSQRGACANQSRLGSYQELGLYWSASCLIAGILLPAGRSLRSRRVHPLMGQTP